MQLAVDPAELDAAAAALRRCVDHLDEAVARFTAYVARDAPLLGDDAGEAARDGARAAAQASHVVATDVRRLGDALRHVAAGYSRVDRNAVGARPGR
ncbi:MAG TPA: hypothetical protein VG708_14495 [Mycobacteriales bacterium]|nr:hypothetical protein [Mycobacteriales bacterium]